jgi:AraC-like DNA-binding protein
MMSLDLGLRGAAIALFLLWAALLLRDARGRIGAAFALGVASYAICSAPGFVVPTEIDWRLPVLALCIANPMMFWLFARHLFEDGFQPKWLHWAAYLGYALAGLAIVVSAQGPFAANRSAFYVLLTIGTLGFGIAAAWTLWRGHGDDLVEQRRRVRPIMMGGAVLYVLAIGLAELGMRGAPPPPTLSTLNAAALAAFAFATLLVFAKGPSAELFAPVAPALSPPPPSAEPMDPLAAKLEALFRQAYAHREPDLTIAEVARRLAVAEHRLRALINQRLGYRNFAAFVNGYRLKEVKAALADPGQANVPISTIAFDAGFGSLGVFNRAFKEAFGVTPGAFRTGALGLGGGQPSHEA